MLFTSLGRSVLGTSGTAFPNSDSVSHPLNNWALICDIFPCTLHYLKRVVFHHLHQACPKKAFPNEAFQMGIQEGPASTTGVYSLNIQLQGLHQFLMWQAMQPFIFKEKKILEEATIMWKHPNKYTYCGKSSDKLV